MGGILACVRFLAFIPLDRMRQMTSKPLLANEISHLHICPPVSRGKVPEIIAVAAAGPAQPLETS
jgi:hypothetical protein